MDAPANLACLLLAAGRSDRFGEADKLAAPLNGRALGDHAAALLGAMPFAAHIAVVRPGGWRPPAPFGRVEVADAQAGLAHSIATGIAQVRALGLKAVLVALADMPFVTRAHVDALLSGPVTPDSLVASSDGTRAMPPALFGAAHFDALGRLQGDRGARDLLRQARRVVAPAAQLIDIDTPAALDQLRH